MKIKTDKELLTKLFAVKEIELKEMYYTITQKSQNDTFTEINAKLMIIREIKDEIRKLKQVIDKS